MTRYEEKILNIVTTSNAHMTIEEIFLALKKEEPKVVLATVYNNVNKLVQKGSIVKLSVSGQVDRYDKTTKHDHLICSECGAISDYCFPDLTGELEQELGEAIEGYDLRIKYICPACRRKARQETNMYKGD